MQLRKYRWSRAYESAEEELQTFLKQRKLDAERWVAEPGEEFGEQEQPYAKQLFCAEGSIVFAVSGGNYSLQPGDALDLPPNTVHSAITGLTGAVLYEVHHT